MRADGPDFSFGGDFLPWAGWSKRKLRSVFDRYLTVFNQFEQLPVPVVAAVQGLCSGGGFELVLRADVIFAGETARFCHPEQTLGITTLMGGVYRVAERAGRARAAEWALTSEKVPAQVMAEAGVINRVVPDDELLAEAQAFAQRAAGGRPLPTPCTSTSCGPGPWAGWRPPTRHCSTYRCRCSTPRTEDRSGVRGRGVPRRHGPAGTGIPRPLRAPGGQTRRAG